MNETINTVIKLKGGKITSIEKKTEQNHTTQHNPSPVPFLNNTLTKEVYPRTYKHLHSALFSIFSFKFSHHQ